MFDVINLWAIIVAVVLATAIGAFWYSPILFQKSWMAGLGSRSEQLGDPKTAMALSTVNTLVIAVCLNLLIGWLDHRSWLEGMAIGAFVWLGFVATSLVLGVLFQGDSWRLFWINAGNQLAGYLAMGAAIGALL